MYASRQQASNTYYLNLSIMVALKYPSEPSGTATVRDHCHSYHFFFSYAQENQNMPALCYKHESSYKWIFMGSLTPVPAPNF